MTVANPNTDTERMLQIRNLDPQLKRRIKAEAAIKDVTIPQLIEAMWLAYERERRSPEAD